MLYGNGSRLPRVHQHRSGYVTTITLDPFASYGAVVPARLRFARRGVQFIQYALRCARVHPLWDS